MKKVLITLFIIFSCMRVYAYYKPIPENESSNYKVEIEKFADTNLPYYKKKIKTEFSKAKIIYLKSFFCNNKNIYIKSLEDIINAINDQEFYFYREMIDITIKYTDIHDLPQTDFVGDYINLLEPYLRDNKITKIKSINSISFYANKYNTKINKMIKNISKNGS